jgi:hypothetical protein
LTFRRRTPSVRRGATARFRLPVRQRRLLEPRHAGADRGPEREAEDQDVADRGESPCLIGDVQEVEVGIRCHEFAR